MSVAKAKVIYTCSSKWYNGDLLKDIEWIVLQSQVNCSKVKLQKVYSMCN